MIADSIVAGTITGDKMVANTITATEIAADTITATEIAADTITAAQIATGTITAASAVIANAAVDTLQLSGQAVTIPSSSYVVAEIYTNDSVWGTVGTVTHVSTGSPNLIMFSAAVYSHYYNYVYNIRVLANGVEVYATPHVLTDDNFVLLGFNFNHVPAAGYITYQVQMYYSVADFLTKNRSLSVLEIKR